MAINIECYASRPGGHARPPLRRYRLAERPGQRLAVHIRSLGASIRKAKGMRMNMHSVPEGRTRESGISLIETMIATVLIMVGLMAVLGLFAASMAYNQAHGDLASRATTYGQTKMEELLALQFADATTNTTVWPYTTTGTGNKGLCGNLATNATCGGLNPASPVADYVDYLDYQGTRVGATEVDANGQLRQFYIRQWLIQGTTTNLKTVTVRTTARRTSGSAPAPFVVLVGFKSRPS